MKFLLASILLISTAACAQSDNQTPLLPNPTMTPGDTVNVTKEEVCEPGYAKGARRVSAALKHQIFDRYGIDLSQHSASEYEIDHLISLELGGSNSPLNLWPQFYKQEYGARKKDALEDRLHAKVCEGEIALADAQKMISTDWISAYKKYFPNR